ncbi:hypothetical protein PASE110613_17090 [Paenibacillus sediminis]|uniref:Uncharacterized protein n=1 Tax=Paenibacillus sediminis TaxID=664909 RepID=A0ABS4H316_9BACL|nr:hypothetical protein [Paenibacillus sediminis]
MTEQSLELFKRNKLMVKLLWGCLVLGIGASYSSMDTIITLLIYGLPVAVICSVLARMRRATDRYGRNDLCGIDYRTICGFR